MSRLSIAILVLIVLGFIMTIQRDEPGVITGDPSVGVVTADKGKKPAQPPAKTTQGTPAVKPKPADTAKNATAPAVTPAPVLGSAPATGTPPQTAQPQPSKQAAITEQQAAGNIPSSATVETAPAPAPAPQENIIEGGENLGREAQRELARLGCFGGDINQRWGRDSRTAIKRFNQAASFSWPDWPSRDMIASLRNFPDAYCKKCRAGAGACDVAALDAQKDGASQPVKSDATISAPSPQPEPVKPAPPAKETKPAEIKPADVPLGAAKITPPAPKVEPAAVPPAPMPSVTAQKPAEAPAQPEQTAPDTAPVPADNYKPKQSVAYVDPEEAGNDTPDAPSYIPPRRKDRSPRLDNSRVAPDERYFGPRPKARAKYAKPAWMRRRIAMQRPTYSPPSAPRYSGESHRSWSGGGWSPRQQGVGR